MHNFLRKKRRKFISNTKNALKKIKKSPHAYIIVDNIMEYTKVTVSF